VFVTLRFVRGTQRDFTFYHFSPILWQSVFTFCSFVPGCCYNLLRFIDQVQCPFYVYVLKNVTNVKPRSLTSSPLVAGARRAAGLVGRTGTPPAGQPLRPPAAPPPRSRAEASRLQRPPPRCRGAAAPTAPTSEHGRVSSRLTAVAVTGHSRESRHLRPPWASVARIARWQIMQ